MSAYLEALKEAQMATGLGGRIRLDRILRNAAPELIALLEAVSEEAGCTTKHFAEDFDCGGCAGCRLTAALDALNKKVRS